MFFFYLINFFSTDWIELFDSWNLSENHHFGFKVNGLTSGTNKSLDEMEDRILDIFPEIISEKLCLCTKM